MIMTDREIDMLSSAVALKLGRMNEPAMPEIQAAQYLDISVRVLKERIKRGDDSLLPPPASRSCSLN